MPRRLVEETGDGLLVAYIGVSNSDAMVRGEEGGNGKGDDGGVINEGTEDAGEEG